MVSFLRFQMAIALLLTASPCSQGFLAASKTSSLSFATTTTTTTTTTSSSPLSTNVPFVPFMSTTSSETEYSVPQIKSALQKPSKILTVCIDYTTATKSLSNADLATLSMQLRKAKAASVWTHDVIAMKEFTKEQASAQGNFPGPCPVVYYNAEDSAEQMKEAIEAGVTAILVSVGDDVESSVTQVKELIGDSTTEIIWKLTNPDHITPLTESGYGLAFYVNDDESSDVTEDILKALPQKAIKIVGLSAMQNEGAEIKRGRELKKLGCNSILIQKACVGDAEDVAYSTHVVSQITSKASSEFSMTGLTGSTNGHFGGVAQKGDTKWRRMEQ